MKRSFDEEVQDILSTDPTLAAAADRLESIGVHYGWFEHNGSWRNLDPIGKLEFLKVVSSIIDAYKSASAPARNARRSPRPS